ncbi:ribbon-helix-helix domain-containing protein [Saccharolobus islandicus]|uniref:CopG domain protein DNA-binding domain protein n=1 Tax=Saccharolobus islandicus (strain M.14.25 / Kamchatka \|nr:ribbon-helix-helix domain-containing protein [Sulfolobus islandicus]ACP38619.1 CopG domain protein DNA-binding domain protein [Sulfolobus islandicus M.14.25]
MLFGKKKEEWKGKRKGKIVSVLLSNELYTKLDILAKRYGVKKSQIIRDAIIEKLEKMQSKA